MERRPAVTTRKVSIGDVAPDFTLPDQTGTPVRLRDLVGRKTVVLYFYPKDQTPGCTVEARGRRAAPARGPRAGGAPGRRGRPAWSRRRGRRAGPAARGGGGGGGGEPAGRRGLRGGGGRPRRARAAGCARREKSRGAGPV